MDCGAYVPSPEKLSAWSALGSTVIGAITVVFVIRAAAQVRIAAEQLRQTAQGSLLAVEESISEARHRWRTARASKKEQRRYYKNNPTKIAAIRYARARDEEAEDYEQFLNRLDRLCAAVCDGLIPEKRAKADYLGMLEQLVGDDTSLQNVTTTGHESITRLYLKWRSPHDDQ